MKCKSLFLNRVLSFFNNDWNTRKLDFTTYWKTTFWGANYLLFSLWYEQEDKNKNEQANSWRQVNKTNRISKVFIIIIAQTVVAMNHVFFHHLFLQCCFAHLMRFTYISTSQQLQWKHRQFLRVNKICRFSRSSLLLLWEISAKLMRCQTIKILLSLQIFVFIRHFCVVTSGNNLFFWIMIMFFLNKKCIGYIFQY